MSKCLKVKLVQGRFLLATNQCFKGIYCSKWVLRQANKNLIYFQNWFVLKALKTRKTSLGLQYLVKDMTRQGLTSIRQLWHMWQMTFKTWDFFYSFCRIQNQTQLKLVKPVKCQPNSVCQSFSKLWRRGMVFDWIMWQLTCDPSCQIRSWLKISKFTL